MKQNPVFRANAFQEVVITPATNFLYLDLHSDEGPSLQIIFNRLR